MARICPFPQEVLEFSKNLHKTVMIARFFEKKSCIFVVKFCIAST